jgi:hypothetical protein
MTYHIETEGSFWGALPRQASGDVQKLPPPHQQALLSLFKKTKEYATLPLPKNAADSTKYTLILKQGKQSKTLRVNDAQLKALPEPVAAAIIYLSNKAKSF